MTPETPVLVIGRIEPPPDRAQREDLIELLIGARAVMAADKSVTGAAYRKGLVKRIHDVIEREKRYLGVK